MAPRHLLSYVKLKPSQVALYAEELPALLVAEMDAGWPVRVDGYGGWEEVALPGQVSATVFRGSGPLTMPLRLVLGGWPDDPALFGLPCARQMDVLDSMARQPATAARGDRPPLLQVKGAVPHGGVRWFVDSLEWDGESVIVEDRTVRRIRAAVTLKQHVPLQFARIAPARSRARDRRVKVKKNETAARIVQRELGLKGRELSSAVRGLRWGSGPHRGARIRDPRRIRPGDVIVLPREGRS